MLIAKALLLVSFNSLLLYSTRAGFPPAISRPGMIFVVDWALRTNCLSIPCNHWWTLCTELTTLANVAILLLHPVLFYHALEACSNVTFDSGHVSGCGTTICDRASDHCDHICTWVQQWQRVYMRLLRHTAATSSSSSAFDGCVLYTLSPVAIIKWVVLPQVVQWSPELAVLSAVGLPCLVTQLVEEWTCLQNVFRRLVSLATVAATNKKPINHRKRYFLIIF